VKAPPLPTLLFQVATGPRRQMIGCDPVGVQAQPLSNPGVRLLRVAGRAERKTALVFQRA